jgi:hypothetical protein
MMVIGKTIKLMAEDTRYGLMEAFMKATGRMMK